MRSAISSRFALTPPTVETTMRNSIACRDCVSSSCRLLRAIARSSRQADETQSRHAIELRMVVSTVGGVKAKRLLIALLICAVSAVGCWWRSYPARMRTHTELLVAFARKGRDLVATCLLYT